MPASRRIATGSADRARRTLARPARRRGARGRAPSPVAAAFLRRPRRRRDRRKRRRSTDRRRSAGAWRRPAHSPKAASTGSPLRVCGIENQRHVGFADRVFRLPASEYCRRRRAPAAGRPKRAFKAARRARRRARCRRCARIGRRTCRQMFGRIAEPKADERRHGRMSSQRFVTQAASHSAATSASVSAARRSAAHVREPRAIEPAERPHRGAAHQRRGIVEQPLGLVARAPRRRELPIAISTLRTKRSRPMRLTGALGEQRAESRIVEPGKFGQRRRAQRVARGKLRLVPGLRELVPRADRQAIVAAIDAVADQRPQRARDRALVLDGEVGDAAPRIELVGRGKGRGRADVEAGLAACRNGRSRACRAADRAW